MKNKRKSIFVIFIIFSAILGLNYYTNAAENLKTVQDKYRASYNNFIKALKEGADQERIDQLSAQCKEDYAEYQKVVKGSNGFDNKPNIPSAKSNYVPKTIEQNIKTIANKSIQPEPQIIFKTVKIKDPKGKIIVIQAPFFNPKLLKPKQSTSKRVGSPLRIGENASPEKIDDFQITPLPKIPCDDNDELKKIGIETLNVIFEKLQKADSSPNSIMNDVLYITSVCVQYPDLCSLARLYLVEAYMKKNTLDGPLASFLKAHFMLIKEYYSDSNYGKKDEICKMVLAKADAHIGEIEKFSNTKRAEADTIYQSILLAQQQAVNVPNLTFNYEPQDYEVNWAYANPLSKYDDLMGICKINDLYDESDKYIKALEQYYSNIPKTVTIKYRDPYGALKSKNVDLKRPALLFLRPASTNIMTLAAKCVSGEDKNLSYEDIKDKIKWYENYIDEVKKGSSHGDTPEFIPDYTDVEYEKSFLAEYKKSCSENIQKIYFCKFEDDANYTTNKITNPTDNLTIRCDVNSENLSQYYPIKLKVKNCNPITKEIELLAKRDIFHRGYYVILKPNSGNDDDSQNLIKCNKNKPSIAICRAEGGALSSLKQLYNNSYFNYKSGYSDFEANEKDFEDGKYKLSILLMQNGGADGLVATIENNKNKGYTLVRNQAKWFAFVGHGNPITGSIGEDENHANAVIVKPEKDDTCGLIKEDGNSEYSENMDVLMLNSCAVLNTPNNIKAWHNVLPNGLIIGYRDTIEIHLAHFSISALSKSVISDDKEALGKLWYEINKALFQSTFAYFYHVGGGRFYAYIYNNTYYRLESEMHRYTLRTYIKEYYNKGTSINEL